MHDQQNHGTPAAEDFPRRALLAGAAGLAVAGVLGSPRPAAAATRPFVSPRLKFAKDIPGTGDIKVLNLALALEDLEADLYAQALQRLTTGGTNALGITIPGLGLSTSRADVRFTAEFGQVEVQHRDFLRSTLGSAAISPFRYNFGIESMTRAQVIRTLYAAELTGTMAYLGAIPFLQSKTYLQIAGAIQGTEARHTAVYAELINQLTGEPLPVAPTASTNDGREDTIVPDHALRRVSPFIVVS